MEESVVAYCSFFFEMINSLFLFCIQIRTLGMLRSRFQSLPGAFNACLIPLEKNEQRKKGLKAALSRKFDQVQLLFLHYW